MKSKEEVERESLSAFCGVCCNRLVSPAGFHIIAVLACACLIELRHGLSQAGTFIYPSTLSNG